MLTRFCGTGTSRRVVRVSGAKRLRKPPRKAAEEIVSGLGGVPGFKVFELAGAGYINARVDRSEFIRQMLSRDRCPATPKDKILVEHTSINPNKAAHIGHLRNAILGDTFVRLRSEEHTSELQFTFRSRMPSSA